MPYIGLDPKFVIQIITTYEMNETSEKNKWNEQMEVPRRGELDGLQLKTK